MGNEPRIDLGRYAGTYGGYTKPKMKLLTRFALAWCAFRFVWGHIKDFKEPESGDLFKFVIEGTIR